MQCGEHRVQLAADTLGFASSPRPPPANLTQHRGPVEVATAHHTLSAPTHLAAPAADLTQNRAALQSS